MASTDFNSGTAHAETERLRQQLREVKARLAVQTQQDRRHTDSMARATTAAATGIWRGIAQQSVDRTAVARAVAEAGIKECSRLGKEEEEKVTQGVEVVDVP